ncbi:MAG: hypothetical protein KatS3mg031_2010 [Chitinophagales bacterium]|nr:MAG: hypothetical protein KatS3mg031_2010 [Chitinophagales bacterium]
MKEQFTLFLVLSIMLAGCELYSPDSTADNRLAETARPSPPPLDSLSIAGIHKNIFAKSCAVNGCHDGSFEPNLTTIQSSYQTLVYHPIIKNNHINEFRYRVVPYDTAASVLYQRITRCCFVNDDDRMPQHTDKPLAPSQIANIAAWILNGAPDMEGHIPAEPLASK